MVEANDANEGEISREGIVRQRSIYLNPCRSLAPPEAPLLISFNSKVRCRIHKINYKDKNKTKACRFQLYMNK